MVMRILLGCTGRLRERWRAWLEPADLTQEQLAALVRRSWPLSPRYQLTQEADPRKARQTWELAMRWYVLRHRFGHRADLAIRMPATAKARRSSSSLLRRSA